MLTLILAAAAAAGGDVAEIRRLRARSNAALAAHRVEDLLPLLTDDYTALPGSSGRPVSAGQLERRLAEVFADPAFVTYVRTPKIIVIASSGKRAAETGTWLGRWRKRDGEMRLTGIYQATWAPRDGGWRLLNESFVTLGCAGSKACSEID
ncbi:MAG TPA: nuclear transport factor 2 family protein [Allosphingosinicella sp.]